MTFPCTKCGACCMQVGRLPESLRSQDPDSPYYFPYPIEETGRCSQLDDNMMCKVYENRPLICNLKKMQAVVEMSDDTFFAITAVGCNIAMDEENINPSFRIKL